jgi:hypothetical protein
MAVEMTIREKATSSPGCMDKTGLIALMPMAVSSARKEIKIKE